MSVKNKPIDSIEVKMYKIAILIYDRVSLFELGCAVELFGLPRPEFQNWYRCEVVSFCEKPLDSTAGIKLSGKPIETLDNFDVLVIPSWPTEAMQVPETTAKAVRKFYNAEKRILSFCSGAFLLAELGFLDGKKATTHWKYAEIFKQRYPKVRYAEDILYTYDGHMGCSAGSSAAIDLGLEMIRRDFGYRIANRVARRLVLSAHRKGGQTQYAEAPVQSRQSPFVAAIDWALSHIGDPFDISTIAQKAHMSRRTFDRKFRANFGLSPKEWLTFQRLSFARELLENQEYGIDKVAELSGFLTTATMRHHFRKQFGISPSQHRQRFNPKFNARGK
jgi:AraC family transcriptional activator FtrA